MHRKVAVAIWIPVAAAALFLFTGPNRRAAAKTPRPTTTTTSTVPRVDAATRASALADPSAVPSMSPQIQAAIGKWIDATPHHRTLPQAKGVARFDAVRQRQIMAIHRNAVHSSKVAAKNATGAKR